jgi:hypothetical protein
LEFFAGSFIDFARGIRIQRSNAKTDNNVWPDGRIEHRKSAGDNDSEIGRCIIPCR